MSGLFLLGLVLSIISFSFIVMIALGFEKENKELKKLKEKFEEEKEEDGTSQESVR